MRQLWPPTYDKFTARLWACVCSLTLHVVFAVVVFASPDVGWWFFIPGAIPIVMLTGGWFTSLALPGQVFVLVANLSFYYFLALWIIAAFRPATNWWPEKRS
jgi:hypothetical protein